MTDPSIGSDLLVVGAASRDIDASDPRGWRLGGTVCYAALAAARLGASVRTLVGVDETTRDARELDLLRDAGVEVRLVALPSGPVFENIQMGDRRRQVAHATSAALPVDALPAEWRSCAAVLLGPVADELAPDWADAFPDAFVALAGQGLLRELEPGQPVRIRMLRRGQLVERADALFVSAEDVTAGASPLDELLGEGQELFVTHGGLGAAHLRRHADGVRARYIPALPRRNAVDTTGTGDVFIASYVAARLAAPGLVGQPGEWRLAAVASAYASLNVVARHLAGVPSLAQLCEALLRLRS